MILKSNTTIFFVCLVLGVFVINGTSLTDINFRTTSDQDHVTDHNGNMNINGLGQATEGSVLFSQYNSTSYEDRYAVFGVSVPQPYYGYGGRFDGGWKGVVGNGSASGSGNRYGGYFTGFGGTGSNYGVYAKASCYSGSPTSYGIYATAWGYGTKHAGYFSGNVTVTGTFYNPSDVKFKKDIKPLNESLDKILKLKPKSFYFDTSSTETMKFAKKKQCGLIAQDLEKVLPDLVCEQVVPTPPLDESEKQKAALGEDNKKPKETYKSINYIGLIPVLINAIQEQQKEIEQLKSLLGIDGR